MAPNSRPTAVSSLARYAANPAEHLEHGHAARNATATRGGERAHADPDGRQARRARLWVLCALAALIVLAWWVQ